MNCVYKIVCKDTNITEFYIGSTKDLDNRKISHKTRCKNTNYKVYKFIKENGGWDNWELIVLEETPNYDKPNRLILEQSYKDKLKPELNAINAFGMDIKRRSECFKKYYENNKEKILDNYYNNYQLNKEAILNKKKKIYQLNKEKLSQKINCPICNKIMNRSSLSKHKKRKH